MGKKKPNLHSPQINVRVPPAVREDQLLEQPVGQDGSNNVLRLHSFGGLCLALDFFVPRASAQAIMHATFFKSQRGENKALFELQGVFLFAVVQTAYGELYSGFNSFFQMNNDFLKSVSAMQSTS